MSYLRDHQVFCMVLCLEKSVPLKLEPCPLHAASRMQSWFVVYPVNARRIGWNVVFPILTSTPRVKTTTCRGGRGSSTREGVIEKAHALLLSSPCALQAPSKGAEGEILVLCWGLVAPLGCGGTFTSRSWPAGATGCCSGAEGCTICSLIVAAVDLKTCESWRFLPTANL